MSGCSDDAVPYAYEQVPTGSRRRLLDQVPRGSRVLDVGCWSGFNGQYLLERGCEIYGVELDPVAAARASGYVTISVGDITQPPVMRRALADGPFDAILLMDVIEHIAEPISVIKTLIGGLRSGGLVLISVPNVAHWTIRGHLLRGRWRYADSGILDRTHLRFFTRSSIYGLLDHAGLECMWEGASCLGLPILRRLRWVDETISEKFSTLFAVQFLIAARPLDIANSTTS